MLKTSPEPFDPSKMLEKLQARWAKMTDADFQESLVSAGILTRSGRLAEPYRTAFKGKPKAKAKKK